MTEVKTNGKENELSKLLNEASLNHESAFVITRGKDPSWARWYSKWLLGHGFCRIVGVNDIEVEELESILTNIDKQYTLNNPHIPWESYYAKWITDNIKPSNA